MNSSAYRFLVHKSEISDIHVNMIIESRDVVFFEDIFPYKLETDKTSGKKTHGMAFRDESPEEPIVNAEIEPRKSQKSRISKSFCPDFIAYAIESEPQTFKEAMSTPEAQIRRRSRMASTIFERYTIMAKASACYMYTLR